MNADSRIRAPPCLLLRAVQGRLRDEAVMEDFRADEAPERDLRPEVDLEPGREDSLEAALASSRATLTGSGTEPWSVNMSATALASARLTSLVLT